MDSGIETNDSISEADKLSKVRLVMSILPFSDHLLTSGPSVTGLTCWPTNANCLMICPMKCAATLSKLEAGAFF